MEAAEGGSGRNLAMTAYVTARSFLTTGTFVCVGLGLLLGISSAANEKRRRTLGLLLLSRLRHWEIVVGKTAALGGLGSMVVLAVLPMFALLGWAGGIDYVWLGLSFALILACLLFGLTLGLFVGFGRAKTSEAVISASFVLALLSAYPLVIDNRGQSLMDHGLLSALVQPTRDFQRPVAMLLAILFVAGWGLAFGLGAWRVLGRAAGKTRARGIRDSFEQIDRFFERINVGGVRFGARAGLPLDGRFPIAKLSRTTAGVGQALHGLRLAVAMLVVTIALLAVLIDQQDWAEIVVAVVALTLGLLPLFFGAGSIAGDRERKALLPLLSTPLSGRAIVYGKALGALQTVHTDRHRAFRNLGHGRCPHFRLRGPDLSRLGRRLVAVGRHRLRFRRVGLARLTLTAASWAARGRALPDQRPAAAAVLLGRRRRR